MWKFGSSFNSDHQWWANCTTHFNSRLHNTFSGLYKMNQILSSHQTSAALLRNALCHFTHRWQICQTPWAICGKAQRQNEKRNHARLDLLTWISWILLKPSLQKNSTRLDRVLGPGISFSAFTRLLSSTCAGVSSLWGMASSPAAEISRASLAADLCKARKMQESCLFSRAPWKPLKYPVVNCLSSAMVSGHVPQCFREERRDVILFCTSPGGAEFTNANACLSWPARVWAVLLLPARLMLDGLLLSTAFKQLLVQPRRWKRIGCSLQQKGGITLYSGVGVSPPKKAAGFILYMGGKKACVTTVTSSDQSISLHTHTHTLDEH